ncbi:hypothetical protein HanHA300_Chr10g0382791 [Helianthus annuus]|nr:hypothetical protein HanHA300_Chr10g0382791 [Helianthus annuus]
MESPIPKAIPFPQNHSFHPPCFFSIPSLLAPFINNTTTHHLRHKPSPPTTDAIAATHHHHSPLILLLRFLAYRTTHNNNSFHSHMVTKQDIEW